MLKPVALCRALINITVKHLIYKAPIALLVFVVLSSVGCGKRGAPIPPSGRLKQRAAIEGFQRGNQIILLWKMPARNAPKGNVQNVARIDVYRLAEPANSPLQLSEEAFANQSTIITTMPVTDADFGLKTLQYKDTLQFVGQAVRLRYAIRFVNSAGQKAAFSNSLLIEPAAKIAAGPSLLTADASQDTVILKWQPPPTNIDGSTPVSIIGYNIYRSTSATEPARLLNKAPLDGTEYADEFFEFGNDYYYFVRAVSAGLEAEPVESVESNILKFRPIDIFPPSAPAAITVAAAPGTISIFFAANPEKDIAGYRIYRSMDPDMDKPAWQLLTPELLKTNTFQDTKVESGKKYFYYLTATDTFGNVSEISEVVSETAL